MQIYVHEIHYSWIMLLINNVLQLSPTVYYVLISTHFTDHSRMEARLDLVCSGIQTPDLHEIGLATQQTEPTRPTVTQTLPALVHDGHDTFVCSCACLYERLNHRPNRTIKSNLKMNFSMRSIRKYDHISILSFDRSTLIVSRLHTKSFYVLEWIKLINIHRGLRLNLAYKCTPCVGGSFSLLSTFIIVSAVFSV